MRLPRRLGPTICAPSRRPVHGSATSLTHIGAGPGKYRRACRSHGRRRPRRSRPLRLALGQPGERDLALADPRDRGADHAGEARSPPVALTPAMRPCLLACVPSWTLTGRRGRGGGSRRSRPPPRRRRRQRWRSSTRARRSRPRRPASSASSTSGPHAGRHDDVRGGELAVARAHAARRRRAVEQDLLDLRREDATPCPRRRPARGRPCRGRGSARPGRRRSTRVTRIPRSTSASAISSPM